VLIADAGQVDLLGMTWVGASVPGNVDTLRCEIHLMDEGLWAMHYQGGVWTEVLGIPVFASFQAASLLESAPCGDDFLLPRTFSDVLPNPPDNLRVKIVRWFQTPQYPWLG